MAGYGDRAYGDFTYGEGSGSAPVIPAGTGGGYRAQTMQDLLGAIIQTASDNSAQATTQAQSSVLNSLVVWSDSLTVTTTESITNANATAWDGFVYNGATYR